MGKGDNPRPFSTSREERELRKAHAYGEIDKKEFKKQHNKLLKEGKITRDGRVVK